MFFIYPSTICIFLFSSTNCISQVYILLASTYTIPETLQYIVKTEGDLSENRIVTTPFSQSARDRCRFVQGDACNMKADLSGFDLVLAANLIDRLHDPSLFLTGISKKMNPGGIMVILSPYTWLEAFTPKSNWIGGIRVNGEAVKTLHGLETILASNGWTRVGAVRDIPFVIRETSRKFQHSFAQSSIWKRND